MFFSSYIARHISNRQNWRGRQRRAQFRECTTERSASRAPSIKLLTSTAIISADRRLPPDCYPYTNGCKNFQVAASAEICYSWQIGSPDVQTFVRLLETPWRVCQGDLYDGNITEQIITGVHKLKHLRCKLNMLFISCVQMWKQRWRQNNCF